MAAIGRFFSSIATNLLNKPVNSPLQQVILHVNQKPNRFQIVHMGFDVMNCIQ